MQRVVSRQCQSKPDRCGHSFGFIEQHSSRFCSVRFFDCSNRMHYPISPRQALKNLRTAIGACAPRCGLPYARHNKRPMRSWCRTNCENLMQITIAHRNPVAPVQRHLWAISNQLNHLESLYDSLACENVVASAHGARSSHVTVRAILGVSSSATPQASSTQPGHCCSSLRNE